MKQITLWQASDGSKFDTQSKCQEHEDLLVEIEKAMKPLGIPHPELKKGWFQHDRESVLGAKRRLLELAMPILKDFPVSESVLKDPDSVHPLSIVGRILDDFNTPISTAWFRLSRIDDQFREHEQPYYAINGPREGHVCLNP